MKGEWKLVGGNKKSLTEKNDHVSDLRLKSLRVEKHSGGCELCFPVWLKTVINLFKSISNLDIEQLSPLSL